MEKISLKERIVEVFKAYSKNYGPDIWINGGEVERFAMNIGYKSSNASRRCRELENEGILEKRINPKNRSVEYRLKPLDRLF